MSNKVVFTVADDNYLPYAKMLERSFKKFHPDIDFIIFGAEDIKRVNHPEPYYANKAFFGKELSEKGYDHIINIDADSIAVGSLDDLFNAPYEVGCVLNNAITIPDPLERQICGLDKTNPIFYVNAGLVASRSSRFWRWWDELNHRHFFQRYQFREQDTLNMIFHYGDLKCVNFDDSSSIYGLWLNGYWPQVTLDGEELVLPESVLGVKKSLKVLHWAGGANAPKMNYRTRFIEPVADRIGELVK